MCKDSTNTLSQRRPPERGFGPHTSRHTFSMVYCSSNWNIAKMLTLQPHSRRSQPHSSVWVLQTEHACSDPTRCLATVFVACRQKVPGALTRRVQIRLLPPQTFHLRTQPRDLLLQLRVRGSKCFDVPERPNACGSRILVRPATARPVRPATSPDAHLDAENSCPGSPPLHPSSKRAQAGSPARRMSAAKVRRRQARTVIVGGIVASNAHPLRCMKSSH